MKTGRREILKLAAGVALARPALALGAAAPVDGRFFKAREMALLDEISECILPADAHSPGARAAGVAAFIDAQLAAKDPKIPDWADERKEARESLAALDDLCRDLFAKGFLEVTPAQRTAVIAKAAEGEGDPKTPGAKAFKWLKEQTAGAYYTSKIGIHEEMEYKGNVLLTEFVGEWPK